MGNKNQKVNLFNAFLHPYNTYENIFLVPDDIWLAITFFLATYIDKNTEKLRINCYIDIYDC